MEFTIDWSLLFEYLFKIFASFILALPVALERERSTQIMGLRTFPLVAIASCGYILLGNAIIGEDPEGQSRIIAGLMSGIGFIGGGAILKRGSGVRGTATAASIWSMGAVGSAVGYGIYEIGIVISLVNLLILVLLTQVEKKWIGKKEEYEKEEE